MPVHFVCPHCKARTLVADEFIGQTGPCGTCGRTVTVPLADRKARKPRTPSSLPIGLFIAFGGLAAVAVLVIVLLLLIFPSVGIARRSVLKTSCRDNLAAIGVALHAYHDQYGSFPPAYVADANGKPMHSWRVLLLPYLNAGSVYKQYDFSKPWDSPENIALSPQMPAVYACPADSAARSQVKCSYMAVVGPGTMFPGSSSTKLQSVTDGLSTTIALVETQAGAGFNWLEPVDIDLRSMQFSVGGKPGQEIGSLHPRGAHVLTADGAVHFLNANTPREYIESMLQISDGVPIPTTVLSPK